MRKKLSNNDRGFALLFTVLISSLLLAIGATIVSATLKNLVFSSSGRESQFAFYAADSAAECALYYDKAKSAFPTTTPATGYSWSVTCNGVPASRDDINSYVLDDAGDGPGYQTAFTLSDPQVVANAPGLCARVVISKTQSDPEDESTQKTVIDSRGYNTCDLNNLRRIERGLRINY